MVIHARDYETGLHPFFFFSFCSLRFSCVLGISSHGEASVHSLSLSAVTAAVRCPLAFDSVPCLTPYGDHTYKSQMMANDPTESFVSFNAGRKLLEHENLVPFDHPLNTSL